MWRILGAILVNVTKFSWINSNKYNINFNKKQTIGVFLADSHKIQLTYATKREVKRPFLCHYCASISGNKARFAWPSLIQLLKKSAVDCVLMLM